MEGRRLLWIHRLLAREDHDEVTMTLRDLVGGYAYPSVARAGIPERHEGRKWGRYILLPLIPDLLVSLSLLGMLWTGTLDVPLLGLLGSGTLEVLLLFMPDVSWTLLVCGSFALAWMVMRTGLVLWALRKRSVV